MISSLGHAKDLSGQVEFRIDPQEVSSALIEFASQAEIELLYLSSDVANKSTKGVSGNLRVLQALEQLLLGTGLNIVSLPDGRVSIKENPKDSDQEVGMKKSKKGLLALLVSVFSSSGSVIAQDQVEGAEDRVEAFEEIVVTASRRQESLQDVAMSVNSIDPTDFSDNGLTTLNDVIDYTPGFSLISEGQRGVGSLQVRGVGQQGGTPVVATYIDDVALSSNGPLGGGGQFFFDGMLGDVERVDMLRGPQGTLYGATSIGGAIRYITRKPSTDELRGSVSVNFSDTKEGGLNKLYSGFVSIPLVEDVLGLTISGFKEDSDGFTDSIEPTSGQIDDDTNGSDLEGLSADLLWNITDNASLRFKYLNQESEYSVQSEVTLTGDNATQSGSLAPLYGDYINDLGPATRGLEHTIKSATFEYDFDWATLTATLSDVEYVHTDITNLRSPADNAFFDAVQGVPSGTTTSADSDFSVGSDKTVYEVRLTSPDSDQVEWIVGLYSAEEDTFNFQNVTVNPTNFVSQAILFPTAYDEKSIFGNLTYYFTENFDVTVGARHSDIEVGVDVSLDGGIFTFLADLGLFPAIPLPLENGSENVERIDSYLVNARYRISSDHSLYARAASGYRPQFLSVNPFAPPVDIDSDSLWTYELGAKGTVADWLQYEVALWHTVWSDYQGTGQIVGGGVPFNAEGDVDASGFEGMFNVRFTDNLSMVTNIGYVTSEVKEDQVDLNITGGQSMPGIPRWNISSKAQYDFTVLTDIDAFVSAGFRFVSGFGSTFASPLNPATSAAVNVDTRSAIQWDINAGVATESYKVTLYATNLFDKGGYTAIDALVDATGNVRVTGTPIRPRTVGLSLSYSF